jgi:hypothetical protein
MTNRPTVTRVAATITTPAVNAALLFARKSATTRISPMLPPATNRTVARRNPLSTLARQPARQLHQLPLAGTWASSSHCARRSSSDIAMAGSHAAA